VARIIAGQASSAGGVVEIVSGMSPADPAAGTSAGI
jgi:hypothetical protein